MDELSNPYSPGAGSPPPELAGRDSLVEQIRVTLGRAKAGRPTQSLMMVGLRGAGKTVLLNETRKIAESQDFFVVMVESTEDGNLPELLVHPLRQCLYRLDTMTALSQKVKRGLRVLRSFVGAVKSTVKISEIEFGLDLDPERGTADSGNLEADLPELLEAVGEAARDRQRAIAIIVDEMQYLGEAEMSALIMAMHRISQRQVPLVLVGAGLPQLVALAGKSKSYAERLFAYPAVDRLPEADARTALREPAHDQGVDFTDDALEELLRVTGGYPYFLQEWGYQAWNLAQSSPIDLEVVHRASAAAIRKLDGSFFRVRFDRLTPREKRYLRALAELGDGHHRSSEVAELLGMKVQSVAPLRNGLIRKGMVYSPAYGDTDFTVPLFGDFMRRTMPGWRALSF